MKKYLKNLEAELKKLKISDQEIAEILADHKEMINAAQEDGLTDDELELKFGNPEQIAKELKNDNFQSGLNDRVEPVAGEGELKDYTLFKAFPVNEGVQKVSVNLVSEDVVYFPYDGQSIQVFAKKLKDPEKYIAEFTNGEFVLKKRKGNEINIFGRRSTPDFGIMMPFEQYFEVFSINTVSGDFLIDQVNSKEFNLKTTSGDFELSNIKVEDAKLNTVSGDFEVTGFSSNTLDISLVSGDCEMENVKINGDVSVNTVSGDFELNNFVAENISFRTVSGDLEGREVYPKTMELKSVSGDIEIYNSNKSHHIEILSKKSLSGDVTIN